MSSCPAPVQVTTEGAKQVISGTGSNKAGGNTTTVSATISLDKTPPMLTITSPVSGAVVPLPSVTVSGTVSDILSGVASVTCQGSAATISGSSFTCVVPVVAGPNTITVQATDAAGNSQQASVTIQGGVPIILSAAPNSGQQGQVNLSVMITGQFTHFVQGTTMANFGAGIIVNNTTVVDTTHATANISIPANATLGARNITVSTGAEVASLSGGFSVIAACGVQSTQTVLPAGVPVGTASSPLSNRLLAMNLTGLQVAAGDTLTITATGMASGGTGFLAFDANGAPGGSQSYSGPVSGGAFPTIVGPSANLYSLIGTISGSNSDLISGNSSWFLVGTQKTMTAGGAGQLVLLFDDALYQSDWAPAYLDNSGPVTEIATGPSNCPVVQPIISTVNPNTGAQGHQNLLVTIPGQNSHFAQGTTTASFGIGITLAASPLTVNSATSVTAVLNIDPAAALGSRSVTLTTGPEIASLSGGFAVTQVVNQPPVISAGPNQTISLPSTTIQFTEFSVPFFFFTGRLFVGVCWRRVGS